MNSTQPIPKRPQTSRQAKRAYKKQTGPRISEAERRRLARAEELDQRAERLREQEKAKKAGAKKKAEREAAEREKRRQLGHGTPIGKIDPGQKRLGDFLKLKAPGKDAGQLDVEQVEGGKKHGNAEELTDHDGFTIRDQRNEPGERKGSTKSISQANFESVEGPLGRSYDMGQLNSDRKYEILETEDADREDSYTRGLALQSISTNTSTRPRPEAARLHDFVHNEHVSLQLLDNNTQFQRNLMPPPVKPQPAKDPGHGERPSFRSCEGTEGSRLAFGRLASNVALPDEEDMWAQFLDSNTQIERDIESPHARASDASLQIAGNHAIIKTVVRTPAHEVEGSPIHTATDQQCLNTTPERVLSGELDDFLGDISTQELNDFGSSPICLRQFDSSGEDARATLDPKPEQKPSVVASSPSDLGFGELTEEDWADIATNDGIN